MVWCDNQGVGLLASNSIFHSRTKQIEIDVHFVKEQVANDLIGVQYVPTNFQTVDIFTKLLSFERYIKLREKLNIVPNDEKKNGDKQSVEERSRKRKESCVILSFISYRSIDCGIFFLKSLFGEELHILSYSLW